jgi:hypothetical protein
MNKIRIALGQVVDPNATKKKEPKESTKTKTQFKFRKAKPKEPTNVDEPPRTDGGNDSAISPDAAPAPKKSSAKSKKPGFVEKMYTIDEIKRELYGFRLMTDPSEIIEGAVIKYIRIDGEDAYKYRNGGFLIINLTTVFHLKSTYGVTWQILTDPNKNIIFYYYPQNAKAVLVSDVKFRTKEEIEESGEGVISQLTPGVISSIMINSQLGGTIPLDEKDSMIRRIIAKNNYNPQFTGIVEKDPNTHNLIRPVKTAKETTEAKPPKPTKIKKEKEKANVVLVPKNKTKESKAKQSKQDYSYESSYSLPEYYTDYSDSISIVRNKARSIPRK